MEKVCVICKKPFNAKSHNSLKCDECKKQYCIICGKEYIGQGKTCSKECKFKLIKETNVKKYRRTSKFI